MKLKQEQIEKFVEIHKDCDVLINYSKEQVEEIANGVANYYLTLFRIYQNNNKKHFQKQQNNSEIII